MSLSKFIISTALLITPSLSQCVNNGCDTTNTGQEVTCDYELVPDLIFACGGLWDSSNAGIPGAEALCADGFSVCDDIDYAEYLGLTYDICVGDSSPIATDYYYISGVSSDGGFTCTETGVDDLFGCATNTTEGWLYINESGVDCGPFGAAMTVPLTSAGRGWRFGWEPYNDDGSPQSEELIDIHHEYGQDCVGQSCSPNTDVTGGVLCCRDDYTHEPVTTQQMNDMTSTMVPDTMTSTRLMAAMTTAMTTEADSSMDTTMGDSMVTTMDDAMVTTMSGGSGMMTTDSMDDMATEPATTMVPDVPDMDTTMADTPDSMDDMTSTMMADSPDSMDSTMVDTPDSMDDMSTTMMEDSPDSPDDMDTTEDSMDSMETTLDDMDVEMDTTEESVDSPDGDGARISIKNVIFTVISVFTGLMFVALV